MQALHVTSMLYQDTVLSEIKPQFIISCPFSHPPTQESRTALICVPNHGHVNVVEKLLAAGADPNHQDSVRNLIMGPKIQSSEDCLTYMAKMQVQQVRAQPKLTAVLNNAY